MQKLRIEVDPEGEPRVVLGFDSEGTILTGTGIASLPELAEMLDGVAKTVRAAVLMAERTRNGDDEEDGSRRVGLFNPRPRGGAR